MAPRTSSTSTSAGPSTATAPTKKRSSAQPSRKSKASWRKNIDLKDVDEHLESQRAAERLGLNETNADSKDAEIFAVDTQGDEDVRRKLKSKKPMKSLQALQNSSAVKPITSRRGVVAPEQRGGLHGTKGKSTGKLSKSEQDRLRRIAGRPVKGPFGAIVESEQGNALESINGSVLRVPKQNAWDGALVQEEAAAAASIPSTSRPRRPHESNDGRDSLAVQAASSATPLSIPLDGQSYNPTVASHSSLLQRAYEIERSKMEQEEKDRAFKEVWRQAARAAGDDESSKSANRFAGMIVGGGDGDDDEEGSEEDSSDSEANDAAAAATSSSEPLRKTREQRKRAQRAKDQDLLAAQRREAKALRHHLSQLPTLEKQLKRQVSARQAAVEERRRAKLARVKQSGLSGQRIGKYKLPADLMDKSAQDVQLGEDLSEGLRGVKPEGNLFRDRFDSFVARGKAEYRRPISEVGKGRRKHGSQRVKEYETHAYKRFE